MFMVVMIIEKRSRLLCCSLARAVFLVKTTKEAMREHYAANKLRGESSSMGGDWQMPSERHSFDSSIHKYVLLCIAMAQFPVSLWLCWL
jgi:hypothetical protein